MGFKCSRIAVSAATTRVNVRPPPTHHVDCHEYSMTVASRFYFSPLYRILYVLTVVASVLCVVWTGWNNWRIPSSIVFISLEIGVSALLVFEVLLRIVAFRRRFWSKWCNVFDFIALVMSLVSVAMYFNEEGFLSELEEMATDVLLAFRNAVQYIRLAIFLKNRSEHIGGSQVAEIDFEHLSGTDERDEEVVILMAESGLRDEESDASDDEYKAEGVIPPISDSASFAV